MSSHKAVRLMTPDEAASFLSVSTRTLKRLVAEGALGAVKCPSSDNLGQLSVVSFGGSGSSVLEVMRFQFGGASAA